MHISLRVLMVCMSLVLASRATYADDGSRPTRLSGALLAYVGTGTLGQCKGKGIYLTHFNPVDGSFAPVELAAEASNPTFLAFHPTRPLLYSGSELDGSAGAETISAYAIDPETGKLTLLNRQKSGSIAECHLAVDRSGKFVVCASYRDGVVTSLPIESDGRLGKIACKIHHTGSSVAPAQSQARAHGVFFDAANRFAFVADLGIDKLMAYRFDSTNGQLTPNTPPFVAEKPGAGPRHFAFHPNGRYGYLINELNSTVTSMAYDAEHGVLQPFQTITTLPEHFQGKNSTAEIAVHPSGKYVYGSNRGDDSIVAYAVDEQTGKLQLIGHESTQGKHPRFFTLDPSGNYLMVANQNSDNVVVFRIDAGSGKLHPTGKTLEVPAPMCVVLLAR